jgi:hypothetical protein
MKRAIEFGKKYSPKIPLVQAENFRFKLAKVAASIAGKIWNADGNTGERLVVDTKCVEAAVRFFDALYQSPTLGYQYYSDLQKRFEVINEQVVYNNIKHFGNFANLTGKEMCEQLLRHEHLSAFDVQAIVSDKYQAQCLIHVLVKHNCILRKHNYFVKTRAFIALLRAVVKGEFKSESTTSSP